MIQQHSAKEVFVDIRNRNELDDSAREIFEECIECGICVKECAFLTKYGTPKKIAENLLLKDAEACEKSFECSLCSLCTAVCPVKIDPKQMFLAMRRYAVASGKVDLKKQKVLINFEKRGTSKRFSFYGLPTGCDTVLFPGCALSGSRQQRVMQLYDHLLDYFPNLGIVLDCCTKPSHDLGRTGFFNAMFSEMLQYLVGHNIKNILVACPSCYAVFSRYGKGLTTRTVYEILARESRQPDSLLSAESLAVQDSCVARLEEDMQTSVRRLIKACGVSSEEMKHHGKKTLCCGEGGGAHFVAPDLAGNWAEMRRQEVKGKRIVTYCAGCANFLSKVSQTVHLLDLFFDPVAALAGRSRIAKSPFTYLNRLLLKWKCKKKMKYAFSRERTFSPEG
jgi:Fe-S oxidoreductase